MLLKEKWIVMKDFQNEVGLEYRVIDLIRTNLTEKKKFWWKFLCEKKYKDILFLKKNCIWSKVEIFGLSRVMKTLLN